MKRKRPPLTAEQLENIRVLIEELERPLELEALLVEVTEYFDRHPTRDYREITPRTMEMLLNKFVRIMGSER